MGTSNFKRMPKDYPLYVYRSFDSEFEEEFDYQARELFDWKSIEADIDFQNDGFTYHKLSLVPGYYHGFQLYVEFINDEYDDFETGVKKEYNEVIRLMEVIAENYGLIKLKVVGTFSNGETIYERQN